MLNYLKKFAIEIVPSVAATVIGAYIVNHYINAKPAAEPPAAAMSTAQPKSDANQPDAGKARARPDSEIAGAPASGVKAKGISEKALLEKNAAAEKAMVIEKPAEKASEKPAETTASLPPEVKRPAPVRAAMLSSKELRSGDDVWAIGLRDDLKLMSQAGHAQKLEDGALFKLRLDYLTDRAVEVPVRAGEYHPSHHRMAELVSGWFELEVAANRSAMLGVATLGLAIVALATAGATGTAVAQLGLVAFIGLAAPHLVRSAVKTTHRWLLPLSALAGGALLLAADVLARGLLAPQELPVGVLTAVLGGGYLLVLMHRRPG